MSTITTETNAVLPLPAPVQPSPEMRANTPWQLTPAGRFMVASLVILVCGMACLGWWINYQIERSVVDRVGFATALYVDSFVSRSLQGLSATDALAPEAIMELEYMLEDTTLGQEVVAFKVWGAGGRVVYSNDSALINQVFPLNSDLQESWQGQITAELSSLEKDENVHERAEARRLLEIYSPVRAVGSGEVIAVAEFYQRTDELDLLIAEAQRQSWLLIIAVTLVMYLLLGGYVQRSSSTIVHQEQKLREQVARLSEVLAQNEELHERVRRAAARSAAHNERFLRRVSAELHDGPAQYLALSLLRLDRVAAACEQLPTPERTCEDLDQITNSLSQAMHEVRSISAGLGLPQLEQINMAEAVSRVVRAHERATNTRVALQLSDLPDPLPVAVKIAVYRVVQESLRNAHRHAAGAPQRVELRATATHLELCVTDDGPGFVPPPPGAWGEHMGLAGMRERVESLGGTFEISSSVGVGTQILASIPLQIARDTYE